MGIAMTISVERGAAFILRCEGCQEKHTVKGDDLQRLIRHLSALKPFASEAEDKAFQDFAKELNAHQASKKGGGA